MEPAEPHPAFSFLQALFQCRELGAALLRFAEPSTLATVKRSLGAAGLPGAASNHHSDVVSSGAAEIARLVLQEVDAPEHCFTCNPNEEGLEVLALLQQAVFGPDRPPRSFMQCVFLASLSQALQAMELVTAALLEALAPHNCLSLYNVAAACRCVPLRRKARALALRAFPTAAVQDSNGLMGMEEGRLVALLCSDRLQVSSELQVFRALAAWTERDPAARQPRLAARIARCVRLASLSLHDIYALGDHPLVASDRPASQLVAQVVIHMMMGVQLESPMGLLTISRRRHRSTGAGIVAAHQSAVDSGAAAAVEAAAACDCGLEEHVGAHASVFEAAACAFARQRRQRQQRCSHAAAVKEVAEPGVEEQSVGACSPAAAASGEPHAPGSVARIAPASPTALDAPTPSAGAGPAAAAAPAVQPTARVRHIGVGIGKRVSSRRTLFDMGGSGSAGLSSEDASSAAVAADDDKELAAAAVPPAASLGPAAAGSGSGSAASGGRMVGSVAAEMAMSPNQASVRALQQQAAAPPPPMGGWQGRKRLRFD